MAGNSVISRFADAVLAGISDGNPGELVAVLQPIARLESFDVGETLVERDALATSVGFLVDGAIVYRDLFSDTEPGPTLSAAAHRWAPIGWSGLAFRRYRVSVVAEEPGRCLSIPLAAWHRLEEQRPGLWARLADFVFRRSTELVWAARHTPPNPREPDAGDQSGLLEVMPSVDELQELYDRSTSFGALPSACRRWMAEHTRVFHTAAGNRAAHLATPSAGIWLLATGRARLQFALAMHDEIRTGTRHIARPGSVLGWTALTEPVPLPYAIETELIAKLALLPRRDLVALFEEQPGWAGAIVSQQLIELRRSLRTTVTLAAEAGAEGGVDLADRLIDDAKALLPVDSRLYVVPQLLRSRHSRDEAFRILYELCLQGTDTERSLAGLILDVVRDVERSSRFHTALASTYRAVVDTRDVGPARLRKVASAGFVEALAHVPYAIAGWENLPTDPNCVVIYNHMAFGEDCKLANGFDFAPDSHFISAMIMERRYGDGLRVSRTNAPTEFWRDDYYHRLGHIPVLTPDSGWVEETPEQKEQRKQRFFDDCREALERGLPIAIAPEGTQEDEDSSTERSPGPLRPGAFLLSGRLPSKPQIVPVALANFDKPVNDSVWAAVIKPGFTMEQRGVDVTDRSQLSAFLTSYRAEFRSHVEEAIALARRLSAPDAVLDGIITNVGRAGAVHDEFELAVRELELSVGPPSRTGGTILYGSSTFRMWERPGHDLGRDDVINLGFGGSTLEACRAFLERLVVARAPDRLVFYAGENDLCSGASVSDVVGQFRRVADALEVRSPATSCWFVSQKVGPARTAYLDEVTAFNEVVKHDIEQRQPWMYIELLDLLVDSNGVPRPECYADDGVHLSAEGYRILATEIGDAIKGA